MLEKLTRYGLAINSHDLLKAIALLLMVVDHVGSFIILDEMWLRWVGRFAMPLFLFLVGYSQRYLIGKDLVIGAVFLIMLDVMINDPLLPANILVSIIVVRLLIPYFERKDLLQKEKLLFLYLVLLMWWPIGILLFDYSTETVMMALCGYLVARGEKNNYVIAFFALSFATHLCLQIVLFEFTLFASVALACCSPILACLLYRYRPRTFNYQGILRMPILLLARYSLIFYVAHLVVLKLAGVMLYPEKYQTFRLSIFF